MLEESGRPTPRSSRFSPGEKTRYPSYKRLGGHRGRSEEARKISSPPESEPRTVQPIVSRYNDYCIRARYWEVNVTSGMLLFDYWRADGSYPTLHRLLAVWCSREFLLGSVPQSSPSSVLRFIYRRSVQRACQIPSCRMYVQKTTWYIRTSFCHADTADVITAWRYSPTLKAKTNLCFYANVLCNYTILVWKQTDDLYTK